MPNYVKVLAGIFFVGAVAYLGNAANEKWTCDEQEALFLSTAESMRRTIELDARIVAVGGAVRPDAQRAELDELQRDSFLEQSAAIYKECGNERSRSALAKAEAILKGQD